MNPVVTAELQRFWSPSIRQLEPYVPGEQPKIDNLLKLNTNENPYPPSPQVVSAIQSVLADQADSLKRYPDPDSSALKAAIARQQGLDPSQVFVGNGSDEVLAHLFKAFFVQDQPILYPDISYSFYPVYCQLFGIQAREIPLRDDFSIAIGDYRLPNGGIIITNPNAPTGRALPLSAIEQLLSDHPDRVVVIDEAYVDFGGQSAVSLIERFANLVVCQTTSKSRSLAGMRVGYALAQPHLIAALEAVKNSFNSYPLDRLAQAAAIASFADETYFRQTCKKVIDSRQQLVGELQALGFDVLPSAANFIFATHATAQAADLAQQLRAEGIIVRHFNRPRISNYLRITVGTDQDHERLIRTLMRILHPIA